MNILLNYYIYILFIPMMFISIILTLISNSWFSLWMMMELNLISMIMMLMFDSNMKCELLMKYYLFQSFQSYFYLISIMSLMINFYYNNSIILIMTLTMMMKLSIYPFHYWYLKIMMSLNWNNIYFFSIINKLIPLYILNNIFNFINYFNMMILYSLLFFSSFFSAISGLNFMNLKIIISFSSMIQLSWMIIMMNFNEQISLIYFIIYNLISMNMFMYLYYYNINNLIQLNQMKSFKNTLIYYNFLFLFFSLSSLPPFFGFLMKWIGVNLLINMNFNYFYILIFIFNSLISMYFYLRIIFIIMMNYYTINKINFKYINQPNYLNIKLIMFNWFMLMFIMFYMLI